MIVMPRWLCWTLLCTTMTVFALLGTVDQSLAQDEAPTAATSEADKPALPAEGKPPEPPADDTPAETPKDAPAEAPKEAPAETPKDAPAETPEETPAEVPKEDPPTDKPADEVPPAESPATESAEPGEDSSEESTETGEESAEDSKKATDAPVVKTEQEDIAWYLKLLIVGGILGLPFLVGSKLGDGLRMQDHGWKIGLTLCTIVASAAIVTFGQIQLGPDLSGGINLIYELDPSVEEEVDTDKLIAALSRRINPGGIKEVTIRKYGSRQIEIIIPKADPAEVDLVKRRITTAGALEFRITASERVDAHKDYIDRAQASPAREVKQGDDVVARWVKIDENEFGPEEMQGFVVRRNPRGNNEVLVMIDTQNVNGGYLQSASRGVDSAGQLAVNFTFDSRGASLFATLTTLNRPEQGTGLRKNLGILLDNTLLSAPNLNEPITGGRGQISGRFEEKDVEFLVSILNAGALPAALNKTPISEQVTSATLGADTVEKGKYAMGVSMLCVLVFMLIYYRFSGIVACLALGVNLLLLLAVMISVKAAFTLPGIAGLVLTVGMAVDANVLIFERIREELDRGAALRMAIRNGFAKATTTIIDANLTTLITAIVLYTIGTDQIKGFAVTLILGILMSMYTAIFCSRIIFDIAERRRWIEKLNMMRIIGGTNIDFIAKRHLAAVVSVLIIGVGLIGVVGRGKTLLDIDFLGGSSVTVSLLEKSALGDVRTQVLDAAKNLEPDALAAQEKVAAATQQAEKDGVGKDAEDPAAQKAAIAGAVREKLGDFTVGLADMELPIDVSVVGVGDDGKEFKIDSSIRSFEVAQKMLEDQFSEQLLRNSMEFSKIETTETSDESASKFESTTTLTFGEKIKHDTLDQMIEDAFTATGVGLAVFEPTHVKHEPGSEVPRKEWDLKISLSTADTEKVISEVRQQISGMVVFPSSSNIGGRVAGDTQTQAGYALFVSLLFIVGYIWLRFQRVMFGLAAVVALLHDVLVTLGILALSAYLVQYAPFIATPLMIIPFKISLPMVAAFLTIIGYSLNDTIVVFDRIREVRGKSPELNAAMINTSINQTLSRTLLTSLTTLIVVAILYVAGGPGIHGFAFALVVGVLVGTYSSIFVASPVLLWMAQSGGTGHATRIAQEPAEASK